MTEGRVISLLAVFIVVVTLIVGGTAVLGAVSSGLSGPSDGPPIQGQSPSQFQPDVINETADPETGEITVESGEPKRILVDRTHDNVFSRTDLEPIAEAMFEAGHSFNYTTGSTPDDYSDTLAGHDALLIIQPTERFSQEERTAVREFVEDGGHVLILAEPTQVSGSSGFFSSTSLVSFRATELAEMYGFQVGAESLYNLDDDANDNNFKSIYATPAGNGPLTEGVETVTFDTAGHVVMRQGSQAEVLFTAAPGTRTLQTRRAGTYPTVARNGSVVFITDSTFINEIEVYDVDNEVFVSNLLNFLLEGQAPAAEPEPTPTATPELNETAENETEPSIAAPTVPVAGSG